MDYIASATAQLFHQDRHKQQVRIVRGVPASGKSVQCLIELMYMAHEQPPDSQGVRKTRFLIIRATYPRLRTTTIKTFKEWFSPQVWVIKETAPIQANAKYKLADGTWVESEVIFMALEGPADIDALKSLEVTAVYINEVHEIDVSIIPAALERTRRFPRKSEGGGYFGFCVFADTNPPNIGHWLEQEEKKPTPGWKVYVQPAPLTPVYAADKTTIVAWEPNPLAENIENLPGGYEYYLDRVRAMTPRQIDQGILNRYGSHYSGRAVFAQSWEPVHHLLPKTVKPDPTLQVFVGMDTTGLNPAAVFCQVINGTVVVLKELIAVDEPFQNYVDDYLGPFVAHWFPSNELIIVTDPANPKDARTGETPVQTLIKAGYKAQTARTNSFLQRRAAVVHYLDKRRGLFVDPACDTLIQGFNGAYLYKAINTVSAAGTVLTKDRPDKDRFADVQDALQYVLMHLKGGQDIDTSVGANSAWRSNRPKALA